MATSKATRVLDPLDAMVRFAERVGAAGEAAAFQKLRARLQIEKLSAKQVEELVWSARGEASFSIPRLIAKSSRPAAEQEQLTSEFFQLRKALSDALFQRKAPDYPETQVAGLAGNQEPTTVLGAPDAAPAIARESLELVHKFSAAVFSDDLETAYALCANELRSWMSVKRLHTELTRGDKRYGGKPLDCEIERIKCIYADQAAREKARADAGWPKDTPSMNRRAIVIAYWKTRSAEAGGRWIAFWVTEEAEGYRVAKFTQFVQ
jgi:hypothetical protein